MTQQIEFLPPADPNITCSPELRARVMHEFETYHKRRTQRRSRIRMTVVGTIGLVLIAWTYTTFHRLSPKNDPIYVPDAYKVPHKGIPPKVFITPEGSSKPAFQYNLPPRYPKYQQKPPKKVGGGNYELL